MLLLKKLIPYPEVKQQTTYEVEGLTVQALFIPYDMGFYINGPMRDTEIVGGFLATRDITLPAGGGESIAKRLGALASPVDLSIMLNDNEIGKVIFLTDSSTGIIQINQSTLVTAGNLVSLRCNAVQEVVNHDMMITLVATSRVSVGLG